MFEFGALLVPSSTEQQALKKDSIEKKQEEKTSNKSYSRLRRF